MKNQVDFLKIREGTWGAINFNNMIPVKPTSLMGVEMKIASEDTKAERDYKNLLANQLSWCNSNKGTILRQAEKLYRIITSGKPRDDLRRRCCDFLLDEQRCAEYRAD